jgi:hypothetical protein
MTRLHYEKLHTTRKDLTVGIFIRFEANEEVWSLEFGVPKVIFAITQD